MWSIQGATPVFADVEPDTLLIDPDRVADLLTPRTRAVIAVDYAGQPCDYDALRSDYRTPRNCCSSPTPAMPLEVDPRIGRWASLADLSAFSFHPVKHIATGEGGMITTDDMDLARRSAGLQQPRHYYRSSCSRAEQRLVVLRNGRPRLQLPTDGSSMRSGNETARKAGLVGRASARHRRAVHRAPFQEFAGVETLGDRPGVGHAYHLFVIRLTDNHLTVDAGRRLRRTTSRGHRSQRPLHSGLSPSLLQGTILRPGPGLCPVAEAEYQRILSLPMFPSMTDNDVDDVVTAVEKVTAAFLDR